MRWCANPILSIFWVIYTIICRLRCAHRVVAKLNGSKILISGNHDRQYDSSLFTDIRDFLTVTLDGVCFSLMHYPLLSWPKKEHGSVQLHGHIHAGTDYNEQNRADGIRRYDAGVDPIIISRYR